MDSEVLGLETLLLLRTEALAPAVWIALTLTQVAAAEVQLRRRVAAAAAAAAAPRLPSLALWPAGNGGAARSPGTLHDIRSSMALQKTGEDLYFALRFV